MKFDALRHRVQRSERLVEGRSRQLQENWQAVGTAWRGLWTPWRIVGAGVVAGFLSGRAEPLAFAGKLGSVRWMEILTTISTFVTEITAANAAASAHEYPGSDEPPASPVPAPRRPASADAEPRAPAPAEAATDLSGT